MGGFPLGLEYEKNNSTCSLIWSMVVRNPKCFKIGVSTSSLVTKSSRPKRSLGHRRNRPVPALEIRVSLFAHSSQTGEHMAF